MIFEIKRLSKKHVLQVKSAAHRASPRGLKQQKGVCIPPKKHEDYTLNLGKNCLDKRAHYRVLEFAKSTKIICIKQ